MAAPSRKASNASRVAAAVAALVLIGLGVTYYFTYEPAPAVAVRWKDGITWQRRAEIENAVRLVRPREQHEDTIVYDLLDIRSSNIQTLLEQPEVEDTGYLDVTTFSVPADAPYGRGWMWIGNRLPGLRRHGVVPAIVVICSLVLAFTLAGYARASFRSRSRT